MKVLIVCSGGMSSSIVVKAVEKQAQHVGMPLEIRAVGSGEFADELKKGYQIALVAPQVRHRLSVFQQVADELKIPIAVIAPQGYSPLGGSTVLTQIRRLAGEK